MIRNANVFDKDRLSYLGSQFVSNFNALFNLDLYLFDENRYIIVYEENKLILGFVLGLYLYDCLEIELVFVDINYRRIHVSKKLFDYLFDMYKHCRFILEVSVDNIPALRLYENVGFKPISIRKGYYNGVDGILMEKSEFYE